MVATEAVKGRNMVGYLSLYAMMGRNDKTQVLVFGLRKKHYMM